MPPLVLPIFVHLALAAEQAKLGLLPRSLLFLYLLDAGGCGPR